MNRFLFLALSLLLLMTAGCVVAPRQGQQMPAPYPSAYPSAYPDEYVPPSEYVVDGPLYYDTYPGVPFYPIFIDTPGSCFCVMPMRYSGGVWLGVTGVVVHRGFFPYRRVEPVHRSHWHQHGGVVNGMRPSRGVFEHRGERMIPLPPAGTTHHRAIEQRVMTRPAPVAPQVRPHAQPLFQQQGQPQAQPQQQQQQQQQQQHQQHRQFSRPEESPARGASPQNRPGPPESRSGQNESRSRSNRCQDDGKHDKRC